MTMNKPRVVAVIQARMTSSRLPGKVLIPLAGKPILWHVVHRLKKCQRVDEIVVATTTNPEDEQLVRFAEAEGVGHVCGSEDNVLSRFLLAARQYNADVVVRICSDSPLIDPELIDAMVEKILETQADYCTCDPETPSLNEGFCPATTAALLRIEREAGDDPIAVEHVTSYMNFHPDKYRIVHLPVPEQYHFTGARVSVDTPADLEFLETLYKKLKINPGEIRMPDVVTLLKNEPDLVQINAHVYQKKATDKSHKVLFRCDGSPLIGYGHVTRCLALAKELREGFGCGVVFAMREDQHACSLVNDAGFPVEAVAESVGDESAVGRLLEAKNFSGIVLDLRSPVELQLIEQWKARGTVIVVLDDPGKRRLAADLVFYPPVPQIKSMDWEGFSGEMYAGWEWILVERSFYRPHESSRNEQLQVLLTMGGSDPAGLTVKALTWLERKQPEIKLHCILGGGFQNKKAIRDVLRQSKLSIDVYENVKDMASLMAKVDFAIASFGTTAYELAVMGIPACYFCLSEDHAEAASVFVEEGIAISLGVHSSVSIHDFISAVETLMTRDVRCQMVERSQQLFTRIGCQNIARVIMERLSRA